MKTVVAETVLLGREAFETLGDVEVLPDREIEARHLEQADALVIRSKTRITPELLKGSAVRFIATATAGFEHIDCSELAARGIGWSAAPGCNADSVADYMTAVLLTLHTQYGVSLEGKTLGIIGVGQVGSRVAKRAEALGLRVLLNDPPRAAREGNNGFDELDSVLRNSDFVTLHVPLIKEEPWPTLRMADQRFFEKMRPGSVFINAARGKVLDADALLSARQQGALAHAVLDVWDPEPQLRADVLSACTIGTPHIAGHSFEGKLNGTVLAYREVCRFFNLPQTWDPAPLLPAPAVPELILHPQGRSDLALLSEAVRAVYDLREDLLTPEKIDSFDKLRSKYRVRREFKNTLVRLDPPCDALSIKFSQAGFGFFDRRIQGGGAATKA
jgi:erythronate-4-phosphate dehydrogenase